MVDPVRVADTAAGSGLCPTGGCGPIAPGATAVIAVAGVAGLPAAGVVGAVSGQVRIEAGASAGASPPVVAVYSADRPTMSNLFEGVSAGYEPGGIVTTGVLSKVGASGAVKVTNFGSSPIEVSFDVTGWYGTVWSPVGGAFQPSDPARVTGASVVSVAGSASTDVTVAGVGGVPSSGVDAVAVVVTAEASSADGSLVVTSSEVAVPAPGVSVTAPAGGTRSALVQVAPGADGKVRVHNTSGGAVGVSVDVVGWYVASDPGGPDDSGFVAVDPGWVWLDGLAAGVSEELPIAPFASPSATDAVAVTVTVSEPAQPGTVTVWSGEGPAPVDGVTVSYEAGGLWSNTTTVGYPADGTLAIEADTDVTVLVTVSGYWLDGRREVTYTYDADGIRQSKTTHAGTTTFGWDRAGGLAMLLEESGPAGRTRYLYGPGGVPIAQQDPDGRLLLLHRDQLGSTRAVTDATTGETVATVTYSVWGNAKVEGDPFATAFGFAGQYHDSDTGLIYMRARYYDPTTGSFLTRDPIETITREPYAYVGGNPLNATDPSGLWVAGECFSVAIGMVGYVDLQGCWTVDGSGVAIVAYVGQGFGSPNAGASGGKFYSNAATADDLKGLTACIGGGAGTPATGNVDFCFGVDHNWKPTGVWSVYVGVGGSVIPGLEGHFSIGLTEVRRFGFQSVLDWIIDPRTGLAARFGQRVFNLYDSCRFW